MRNLKFFLFVIVLVLGLNQSYAQQEVQFSQYMFNGMALNPAYAGSHDALSLTGLVRKQWVKIDGAPTTQTFSAHSPIPDERMGVGLQLIADQIGASNETSIYGSYAYWIPMSTGKFAMGLQAGVNLFKAGFTELDLKHQDDVDFSNDGIASVKPNFGFGLYYYTQRFYAGVSVPKIVQNSFSSAVSTDELQQIRHYFVSAGYVIDIGANWKFKPNVLMKAVTGAPLQIDLNANFLFIEKLWLGLSWRTFDSFDLLAQFYVTPQLSLGYAYDLTTSGLSDLTTGSHELMVNYVFKFNDELMLTPRYF